MEILLRTYTYNIRVLDILSFDYRDDNAERPQGVYLTHNIHVNYLLKIQLFIVTTSFNHRNIKLVK